MDFAWLEIDKTNSEVGSTAAPAQKPVDSASHHRVAADLRRAGFLRSSTEYYAQAVGLDDRNFNAWMEYIDTLVRARQLKEADRLSAQILDSYRKVRVLYASRALVLAHRGALAEALSHSEVSLSDDEPHPYPKCVRAELLLRSDPGSRRHREDAGVLFDAAALASGGAWDVYFVGGCALMDARWSAHAAGYFAEAIHREPRGTVAWLCMGDCFHDMRLYDQALFYYEQAMRMEPTLTATVGRRLRATKFRYGLMRIFNRKTLQQRWEERYNIQSDKNWEPTTNDF